MLANNTVKRTKKGTRNANHGFLVDKEVTQEKVLLIFPVPELFLEFLMILSDFNLA